jgi:hypothetical protein
MVRSRSGHLATVDEQSAPLASVMAPGTPQPPPELLNKSPTG